MTEVIVFLIVGSIAIASAAMMLISQNAVHAAIYLVLNFICVAFFFLTLGAPFISLVQIAVYAGAIMVLFLFVIMLLGAERVTPGPGVLPWLPRTAVVLALVFLLTIGGALSSGEINLQTPPPPAPQVRVIHAAEAPPVDVYLNNQLFAAGVDFRAATDYQPLAPGEYGVTVFPAGADPATEAPAILGDLVLVEGDTVSMVLLGADGVFQVTDLPENLLPTEDDQARLTLINGLPDVDRVDLVDPGLPSNPNDDEVLIQNAGFGETVETLPLEAVTDTRLDVVISGGEDEEAEPLVSFRSLTLEKGTNNVLIVAPERLADGRVRIVPLHIATPTEPLYGSPQAVAAKLFSTYLLPFELVSILLLVAMIGAIVMTRDVVLQERRPRRPIVRRPLVGPMAVSTLVEAVEDEEDVETVLTTEAGG